MKKEVVFGVPPYAIYECTALIEMQTSSITHDGDNDGDMNVSEVRPNIYINKEYVDHNVCPLLLHACCIQVRSRASASIRSAQAS